MKKLALIFALTFTMGLAASTVNASTIKDDTKKTEKKECTKTADKKECTKETKSCCSAEKKAACTETKTEKK
ncbi:MAG TPA: hypothetical protein VFC65_09935 [Prolixibacteraceae bacterium]|nr:hypothetical protein [Prolixibacteraceae bacterium]